MKESICLALGFFDSVHFGHRKIIEKLKAKAEAYNVKPLLSTFTDSFSLNQSNQNPLVYTLDERITILKSIGINDILQFDFNDDFKKQSPQEFLDGLLMAYDIKYIVCGYDYRFGNQCLGDTDVLSAFCTRNGIEFEVVDKVCLEEERVSSSKVKMLLRGGEIERANQLLTTPYFIIDRVVRGRGEGQKNSFPTINMLPSLVKLMPKSGVYATKTLINDKIYDSVTNVGMKPTFGDFSFSVETFIDGFKGEIYGEMVKVIFYKYLRGIERFASKDMLASQILKDIESAKRS